MSELSHTRIQKRRQRGQRQTTLSWPDYDRAKDINYHPLFRGGLSRALWRFWMYRLTAPGQYFALLSLIFAAYGSTSLELQTYVPFAYLMGIWVVAVAGALLYRPRVAFKAEHAERVRAGATLPIDVEIRQMRRHAVTEMTIIPHRLPPALDADPKEGVFAPLLPYGRGAHLRIGIRCAKRGIYHWRGFRVETDYPFGLLRAYRIYTAKHTVLVYPGFTPLTTLSIPTGRRYQPGGVALASNLGESFEYIGNREYREGDNVRDIDWRATARLNTPIVREYREEYFLRVGVVLDTYLPQDASQEETETFEQAISLCAAAGDFMARSDYLVDIFAAGPNLYHLTAGRSLAYLDQILDILACVEGNPEEPFRVLEPELLDNLARITTVICIFMDWNETRSAFVHRLFQAGTALKVIVVRNTACTLDPGESNLPGGITVLSAAAVKAGIREL